MSVTVEQNTATLLQHAISPPGFVAYDITRDGDLETTLLYKGAKSLGRTQFLCNVIYDGPRRLTDEELLNFCDGSGREINLNHRSHFGGTVQYSGTSAFVTVYID